ncbi:RND family transporter [Pararhizobium sp. IMCC21322]|uniref:efflux RND transporter permease subunit n=1 Tax=Pararhizobium sp. IMCC21322 TaxID=3067903 RepID=UPI002740DDC5|nr:MMPL family transporter [Pararhizobium sp. IMCC21322]
MLARFPQAHRLGQMSLHYPKWAVVIVVIVTALSIFGISTLKFDDGVATAFRSKDDIYRLYSENKERFTPSENDQAILFRSSGFDDPENLERVRNFALEISLIDGVEDVFSIFSLRTDTGSGSFEPALPVDLSELGAGLSDALKGLKSHPLERGQFLSEDLKSTLVLYHQNFDRAGLEASRIILSEVQEAAQMVVEGSDVTFEVTGLASIRQILIDSLLGDLMRLNLIGMTLGFLIALVALRSVVLAFLTSVPSNIALFWSLGSMGLSGIAIDTLTNVIPVLILVLSLADSLHLTYELRRNLGKTSEMKAIADTLQKIAPACVLTSITTAIAFSTLLISQSELVRNLGLAGLMSVLVAVVAVLLVHPLVFILALKLKIIPKNAPKRAVPLSSYFDGMHLVRFGTRHAKVITYLSIIVLLLAIAGHSINKSNYSFITLVHKSQPEVLTLRQIEETLAPTMSIDLPIEITAGKAFAPQVLQEVHAVQTAIETALPDNPVFSISLLAQWIAPDSNRLDRETIVIDVFEQLSETTQTRLLNSDRNVALMRVQVADHGATETKQKIAEIRAAYSALEFEHIRILEPTGLLPMSAIVGSNMIRHLNISFLLAVIFSGILIAVWFGHWRYGFFCIAPNVLPIAMVGGWLFLMGWPLEMPSAVALTIAFGIAVDDTIHVLNRLKFDAPIEQGYDKVLVEKAFQDVSPVLVTTTAVLGFGTLGSQWSSTPAIAYFGALTIAIFILALFAVLTVLPAWLEIFGKSRKQREISE